MEIQFQLIHFVDGFSVMFFLYSTGMTVDCVYRVLLRINCIKVRYPFPLKISCDKPLYVTAVT
jgi:hypothetical protein